MTGSQSQFYICLYVCVCVCACVSWISFFLKDDLGFKYRWTCTCQRDYYYCGKKRWKDKKKKKSLVTIWERTANKYCWSGPILFSAGVSCLYIYVFSIIPFFLLGVGYGDRGWVFFTKERREKNRVFCYRPIRGWQYVYIYIVYMWWKCVGFLCDTTFYLYYGSTFSVSVLIIYIWFVFYFLFWFCLCHFLYFFSSYLSFFCLLHGLLLLLSNEVTQLLFVFV